MCVYFEVYVFIIFSTKLLIKNRMDGPSWTASNGKAANSHKKSKKTANKTNERQNGIMFRILFVFYCIFSMVWYVCVLCICECSFHRWMAIICVLMSKQIVLMLLYGFKYFCLCAIAGELRYKCGTWNENT